MALDHRGTLSQQGNMQQVTNALVEDVTVEKGCTGFILISYTAYTSNQTPYIDVIRLNVDKNTKILNLAGRSTCLSSIRKGMWINAVFSSSMTRSIPPQANAFLILIRRGPQPSYSASLQRIISVDAKNNSILAADPLNIARQTRFMITNNTIIRNRSGNVIGLSDLQQGQLISVLHANFQTASIPAQTTAFYIQVL